MRLSGVTVWLLGAGWICAVGALAGTRPVAGWLLAPLTRSDPLREADAIVVLGAGTLSDGTLAPESASGVLYGVRLLELGWAPRLIVSGGTHRGVSIPDAEAMARLARRLGAAGPAVLVDPTPTITVLQARSVAALAARHGVRSVVLVAPPLKSRRAALAFRRAGLEVVAAPGPPGLPASLWVARDTFVRRWALTLEAAQEYAALVWYRWRGWA
jgi:uncharacterized SAM-binding protein YcdF (DUF218 family)